MAIPLAETVRQAQRGDVEAFTALVHHHQNMAVGYALALLGDVQRAEDAAQDAFVQAYGDLPSLREPAAFAGWLRRLVFKHCDRQRRTQRPSVALAEDVIGSAMPDQQEALEREQTRAVVRRAIAALPESQRQTVVLYYMGGRSQAEVAEFLEISEGAVKKRLHDARCRLKEDMLDMVKETLSEDAPSRDDTFADQVLSETLPLQVSRLDASGRAVATATTAAGRQVAIPSGEVWIVEPRAPLDDDAWDRLLGIMKDRRIPGLSAGGHLSDRHLARIGELGEDLVYLDLSSANAGISDEGLRHLSQLPRLRHLDLNLNSANNAPWLEPAAVSDAGLACLGELRDLETLSLNNLFAVGDRAIEQLQGHTRLRRLELVSTMTTDRALDCIQGNDELDHLGLGPLVTAAGLERLAGLRALCDPARRATLDLGKCPLVDDEGLRHLAALKGLERLVLCETRLVVDDWVNHMTVAVGDRAGYGAAGLGHLRALPGLRTITLSGELVDDDALVQLGGFQALGDFECGYAVAGDRGFAGLAESATLERLHAYCCHGLGAEGVEALARLPKLSFFSVGSERLDDDGLAPLADFAALREFGLHRGHVFSEDAFAHIARAPALERVSMAYARRIGDGATAHLVNAPRLKSLSLTGWLMGDRSCELLMEAPALEDLHLDLRRVTDGGLLKLNGCKKLRRLAVDRCPFVTDEGIAGLRDDMEVAYKPGIVRDFIEAIVHDETVRERAVAALEERGEGARAEIEGAAAKAERDLRPIFTGLLQKL